MIPGGSRGVLSSLEEVLKVLHSPCCLGQFSSTYIILSHSFSHTCFYLFLAFTSHICAGLAQEDFHQQIN